MAFEPVGAATAQMMALTLGCANPAAAFGRLWKVGRWAVPSHVDRVSRSLAAQTLARLLRPEPLHNDDTAAERPVRANQHGPATR